MAILIKCFQMKVINFPPKLISFGHCMIDRTTLKKFILHYNNLTPWYTVTVVRQNLCKYGNNKYSFCFIPGVHATNVMPSGCYIWGAKVIGPFIRYASKLKTVFHRYLLPRRANIEPCYKCGCVNVYLHAPAKIHWQSAWNVQGKHITWIHWGNLIIIQFLSGSRCWRYRYIGYSPPYSCPSYGSVMRYRKLPVLWWSRRSKVIYRTYYNANKSE